MFVFCVVLRCISLSVTTLSSIFSGLVCLLVVTPSVPSWFLIFFRCVYFSLFFVFIFWDFHFGKLIKSASKILFTTAILVRKEWINTGVSSDGKQGSVPISLQERLCHTKWNLTPINLMNCTCIRQFLVSFIWLKTLRGSQQWKHVSRPQISIFRLYELVTVIYSVFLNLQNGCNNIH